MALPKMTQPVHVIDVPSQEIKRKFRPMLVQEERLLLMAKESLKEADILDAIKQCVTNCALDTDFDVDQLAIFDLEWVFIQLRSASVSNMIEQTYEDAEDGMEYKLKIDLNRIEMPVINLVSKDVSLGEHGFLRLRYPPAKIYGITDEDEALFQSVEAIYNGDQVTKIDDKVEFLEWYKTLPINTSIAIDSFFESIPTMSLILEYKNSKGSERKIELRTLSDFFDLG